MAERQSLEVMPATHSVTKELLMEQLENFQIVLEANNLKLFDMITKHFQSMQQQSYSQSLTKGAPLKSEIRRPQVTGFHRADARGNSMFDSIFEKYGSIEPSQEATMSGPSGVKVRGSKTSTISTVFKNSKKEREPSRTSKHQVFPDEALLKEKIRQAISKPEHKVEDYYYDSGIAQAIARSPIFEQFTLAIIAVNSLWISIEIDNNNANCLAQSDVVFQIIENFFCTFFFVELLIRFFSFRQKINCFKDSWFVFDTALMVMMVLETWAMFTINMVFPGTQPDPNYEGGGLGDSAILKILRLLRLLRTTRLIRLLRSSPELIVLMKGWFLGVRSVFYTFLLMLLIAYVFAIVLTQLTAGLDIGDRYFPTVPLAIKYLLAFACFPDLVDFIDVMESYDTIASIIFCSFLVLISLTLLNMLVGILVNVITVISKTENEKLLVEYIRDEVLNLLKDVDDNNDNLISLEEFTNLLQQEKVVRFLTSVGVDVGALVDYLPVIFNRNKEFEYADIINLTLQLRGSNTCTVKDVVDLRQWINKELFMLRNDFNAVISGDFGAARLHTMFQGGISIGNETSVHIGSKGASIPMENKPRLISSNSGLILEPRQTASNLPAPASREIDVQDLEDDPLVMAM